MKEKPAPEHRLAEVEACVPTDRPMTAREIWERVGRWAPDRIKFVLRQLAEQGRVQRIPRPYPKGAPGTFQYVYQRKTGNHESRTD